MNELRQKWIDALRSGDYKQGRYRLRDENNCYCCLGVLADISGVEWTQIDERHEFQFMEGSNAYDTVLPPRLLNEVGMGFRSERILTQMNDQSKSTFSEIADFIENPR